MDHVFEVVDMSGRVLYLTKERWVHIKSDHPEMATELIVVKNTVSEPEFVRRSQYDDNVRFYCKYFKNRQSTAKYLLVAIKRLNGKGFVITAFYTNKPKGDI